MDSLSKETEKRPQTAEAFASKLRANSEGLSELFRRALVIYSEHLPKFILLSFLTAIPFILLTISKVIYNLLEIGEVVEEGTVSMVITSLLSLSVFFAQIFYAAFLIGMTTWIVAQVLATPLRPVSLRAAFKKAKSRWKPLMGTVTLSTLLAMISWAVGFFIGGLAGCIVGAPLYFFVSHILAFVVGGFIALILGVYIGVYVSAIFALVAPSIVMEDLSGRKAFRRSIELVKRSFSTVFVTTILLYLVPAILASLIALGIGGIVKSMTNETKTEAAKSDAELGVTFGTDSVNITTKDDKIDSNDQADSKEKKEKKGFAPAVSEQLFELSWLPIVILISSLTSVVTALLYFKTRQAGGETMNDLLEQFEEEIDGPRSRWQQRVRDRLVQSGRITSSKKITTG